MWRRRWRRRRRQTDPQINRKGPINLPVDAIKLAVGRAPRVGRPHPSAPLPPPAGPQHWHGRRRGPPGGRSQAGRAQAAARWSRPAAAAAARGARQPPPLRRPGPAASLSAGQGRSAEAGRRACATARPCKDQKRGGPGAQQGGARVGQQWARARAVGQAGTWLALASRVHRQAGRLGARRKHACAPEERQLQGQAPHQKDQKGEADRQRGSAPAALPRQRRQRRRLKLGCRVGLRRAWQGRPGRWSGNREGWRGCSPAGSACLHVRAGLAGYLATQHAPRTCTSPPNRVQQATASSAASRELYRTAVPAAARRRALPGALSCAACCVEGNRKFGRAHAQQSRLSFSWGPACIRTTAGQPHHGVQRWVAQRGQEQHRHNSRQLDCRCKPATAAAREAAPARPGVQVVCGALAGSRRSQGQHRCRRHGARAHSQGRGAARATHAPERAGRERQGMVLSSCL